jgi:hypothetical protein
MSLGCENHTAYIYDRGGMSRLFQIEPLTSIQWERLRDDISHATVHVVNPGPDCQEKMTKVHPNRMELVIFRGKDRVWEGPISRMAWHRDRIEIEAKDVMHYAYRTIMRSAYKNGYPNITTTIQRAINILGGELIRKESLDPPINVLPHIIAYTTDGDSRTSKNTVPYQSTVFDDIDAMAWRAGLDYTVLGRSILLFDTHTAWFTTPTVTEADFLSEIIITQYGMEHATYAAVTSAEGVYGTTPDVVDPFYGEWEILDNAYDEDGTTQPTVDALTSQAVRNLDGRNPVPMHVRVPDGSQLNPNGTLKMEHLIPGVRIPLRATLLTLEVAQLQKLDRVVVTESGEDGEKIAVTLSPASLDDEPPEE